MTGRVRQLPLGTWAGGVLQALHHHRDCGSGATLFEVCEIDICLIWEETQEKRPVKITVNIG